MHFSTWRQIFYAGGLIFYGDSTGTKACVTAADLIDSDENMHCFMRPLSSCDIKISVVSQCRILMVVQYTNTQLFAFFFWLTTCTCWTAQWLGHCWRGLTQTELADWQQTHEPGNTNTNLKLTQTAATQYISCTLPTNSKLRDAADASTMAEQLHPQQPSHNDTMLKKCYLRDFKKPPYQNSSDADIEGFVCRKLKIINECTCLSSMP